MKIRHRTRPLILPLIALILALPLAYVEAGGKNAKPKLPPKPQYTAISALDATAHTITCKQMNGRMTEVKTMRVDERTEIEVGGEKATFNDLKVGMQVDVTVGMDENLAARLVAKAAPPEPTPFPTPNPRATPYPRPAPTAPAQQ